MGDSWLRRLGIIVLAAAGGGIAGATQGGWWPAAGGAVGAVAGLLAAVGWDQVAGGRATARAARDAFDRAVAGLPDPDAANGGGSVFELLLASRARVPFRGRSRELGVLTAWCDDPAPIQSRC
jgi:hypothetical protein